MDVRKKFQEGIPEHFPEDPNEAFPVFMPRGVRDIILDQLNKEILLIQDENEKKNFKTHSKFKLFGRGLDYFTKITDAANGILQGDEESILSAVALVKNNPIYLFVKTKGVDALNREIEGTLIQIAAMAGDVNLLKKINDNKKLGIVERLQLAGGLSDEDVKEQITAVLGKEAMQENAKRNQLILARMELFIHDILEEKVAGKHDFDTLKIRCKPLVEQLKQDLYMICNHIKSGYVFDLNVLIEVGKLLQKKINLLGGWHSIYSGLFWVYGIGLLQNNLSIRDLQVISNLKNYFEKRDIPERGLLYRTPDLGKDYSLDYEGNKYYAKECWIFAPENIQSLLRIERLISNKENNLKKWLIVENPSLLKRIFS